MSLIKKNIDKHWWLWLLSGLLIFAGLSLAIGLQQSVWFDEAYSVTLAKKPVAELIYLTSIDVHPPLYYLLLKTWGNWFGFNDVVLRLLSVGLMTLALLAVAILIKKMFGKTKALAALLAMMLAPMLLRYGFEVRMYSLATAICMAATLLLYQLEFNKKLPRRRLYQIAYAILVAAGMLTLYYTVVIWLTHFSYLVYRSWKLKRRLWQQAFWWQYALAVLFFAPWLPTAFAQMTNGALANISEPLTIPNLLGIVSFNLMYRPIWQLDQILGAVLLIGLVAGGATWYQYNRRQPAATQLKFGFLNWMIGAPVVVLFIICVIKPMYVERYLVYFAPLLMAAIGCLMWELLTTKRSPICLVGVVAMLLVFGVGRLTTVGNFNFQRLQKPDVSAAVQRLDERSMVVTDSPYEAIEVSYFTDRPLFFYAPYDYLGGGYAPLNNSQYQLKELGQLMQQTCFVYIHYNEDNFAQLQQLGFEPIGYDQQPAMKTTKMCKITK